MGRTATVTLKTKTPPDPIVRRRRAVMIEAGLEHAMAAEAIERLDGIPTARQSITNCINGHFPSERIEAGIVALLKQAFTQQGRPKRAEDITLAYMGWDRPGRERFPDRKHEPEPDGSG